MEETVATVTKNKSDEIKSDEENNKAAEFKEEEIASAPEANEPTAVSKSPDDDVEEESKSEKAEKTIATIVPDEILEISTSITEINANLDHNNETDAQEGNASQTAENCECILEDVNLDTETTTTTAITVENFTEETREEIAKKILSTEKINLEESEIRILSTIKTDLVDLILKNCSFDENKQISYSEESRLKRMIADNFAEVNIDKVEKLCNKYLYAAFMLKKNEKQNYRILEAIHSTAAENVSSIEKENLNWRLVRRAKYGIGVSFSTNADYANYHSSWSGGNRRAFVICDVLMGSLAQVNDNQNDAPAGNIDTFRSYNGHVYVKFDDFAIYPKYALYYDKPSCFVSKFYRKRRYDSDDDRFL